MKMLWFIYLAAVSQLVVGQFPLYAYDNGSCILGCGDGNLESYGDYIYPGPFYGNVFDGINAYTTSIEIYEDGVISFDPFYESFEFTFEEFPLFGNGTSIVAPFLADVDLSEQGSVWNSYINPEDIIGFIRGSFPDENITFISFSRAFTWKDVTFFGSSLLDPPSNTFQAVIVVTYGDNSNDYDYGAYNYLFRYYSTFAIFNYGELTWTTGANEDNDGQADGLGGFQAQAGFNAGDGERSLRLPGSRSDDVLNLRTSSNVGIPGRWIFKIDERQIEGFTCSNEGNVGLAPPSGVLLGGTVVSIMGPCFNGSNTDIVCRFGTEEVSGEVKSVTLAECVTPAYFGVGPVNVNISLDGGSNFNFRGQFIYLSPSAVVPGVTRVNPVDGWLSSSDSKTILWSRRDFPVNTSNVFVEILGYCESDSDGPQLRVLCEAGNVNVTFQAYNVTCPLSSTLCIDNENCVSIGAVRLRDPTSGKQLWSDFHPLQWLCPIDSTDWCESDWNELNSTLLKPINRNPCPCTLQQARTDGGRFVPISGGNCGSDDPSNCACRTSNVTCFRIRQADETDGSCNGQECCYFNDAMGQLLNRRHQDVGFSYRAHQDGCSPYKSAEKVPWLSHLLLDVFPWYHCCKWSNSEDTCRRYKELRPPPDCGGYVAPTIALCTGDPHILTLDGNMYTFNGYGEYLMVALEDNSVVLQARNLPISSAKATAIKAVAACVANVYGLHVEVRPGGGLDAWVKNPETGWYFVSVQRNNETDYTGFKIARGANRFFESEESLSIAYQSGLGLYFNGNTGREGIITVASTGLRPNRAITTRGLLGTWNNNRLDDYTARNGTVYHVNSTLEELHEFGISWEIDTSESCFYYREGENPEDFRDPGFRPSFELPTNPAVTPEMLQEVCGANSQCRFDFLATGNKEVASMTLKSVTTAMEVMAIQAAVGVPCPSLSDPLNGIVIVDALIGGSATYSCNAGFQIVGNAERTCGADSTWSGSEPTCVTGSVLSCIVQRPFVGIREDESVVIYAVPIDQAAEDSLGFIRAFYTANGYGLPASKQENTDFGRLLEMPLPNRKRGERFGVFACRLNTKNGNVFVPTVVTSKRRGLLPFNKRVTMTVSVGDDVNLRVTRTAGNPRRIRWVKGKRRMTQWNGETRVPINKVTVRDAGLYEVFQRGRRVRGLQTFILLHVRACPANRYGDDCMMNCPDCQNGGMCEDTTGECTCPPGFTGNTCEEAYEVSRCSNDLGAGSCQGFLFCFYGKFGCICGPGFQGIDCKERCGKGRYGAGCTQRCDGGTCDPETGE